MNLKYSILSFKPDGVTNCLLLEKVAFLMGLLNVSKQDAYVHLKSLNKGNFNLCKHFGLIDKSKGDIAIEEFKKLGYDVEVCILYDNLTSDRNSIDTDEFIPDGDELDGVTTVEQLYNLTKKMMEQGRGNMKIMDYIHRINTPMA